MKKTKNRIVAILLAILVFAVSLAAFGFGRHTDTASALSEDYNGEPDTIYYFFDYYPSTTYSEMIAGMPEELMYETNIVYERFLGTEQEFNTKVNTGDFNGFGERCSVIIDIKRFVPSATILQQLFQGIKNQHTGDDVCETTFITVTPQNYYDYSLSPQLVDNLIYTDYNKLEKFISKSVEDLLDPYYGNFDDFENVCILVDGNTILNKTNNEINETAPFLDMLAEKLLSSLRYTSLNELYVQKNISVLVNTEGDNYLGVGTESFINKTYSDVNSIIGDGYVKICAIGFWKLEEIFFEMLYNGQQAYGSDIVEVHILEADPFSFGENGLICYTYGNGYDGVTDDALE